MPEEIAEVAPVGPPPVTGTCAPSSGSKESSSSAAVSSIATSLVPTLRAAP